MWTREESIETEATADAVWRLWADVGRWSEWNAGVERCTIDGAFANGSEITMTPPDGEPIRLRLAEVVPGERFVDEAVLDDIVVRTLHAIEPAGAGSVRIVYRMEIDGPAADQVGPQLGP